MAKYENLYEPNCIRTFTGKYINIFEPDPSLIEIEDIAHALSHQCRFGGHLREFYSVAQHSYMCCDLVSVKEDKLAALMHDASEAYLLDIPTPIKKNLTNYYQVEDKLMKVIAKKFGFEWPLSNGVKVADSTMLHYEWDRIMIDPNGLFTFQTPAVSKAEFLKRFKEYYNEGA